MASLAKTTKQKRANKVTKRKKNRTVKTKLKLKKLQDKGRLA